MKRGFTLIELLVAIAIIMVLMGILLPVFAQAQERARQTYCLNNVKQISLAWQMYAEDYNGRTMWCWLPRFGGNWDYDADLGRTFWYEKLQPYARNEQIFLCPSASPCPSGFGWPDPVLYYCDYSVNRYAVAVPVEGAKYPAGKVAFLDGGAGWYAVVSDAGPGDALVPGEKEWCHDEGMNVAFFDGHAKWHKMPFPRQLTKELYWRESDVE